MDTAHNSVSASLPQGWVDTCVGDIFRIVGGGTPSTANASYWNGEIDWITSADIVDVRDIRPRKRITPEAIKNSACKLVPEGSIIVSTRVGLGKVGITPRQLCFSQDSQGLIFNPQYVFPDYAAYFLKQATQIFKSKGRGTTITGVPKSVLRDLPFLLPPYKEQGRIVSEIDRQFTRLDAGVKALEQTKAHLKRYRASVLKAACEGRLVPQNPKDEPADKLLARILKERRRKWEEQELIKMKTNRKQPYDDQWKERYKEPTPPDTTFLPEIPKGWIWTTLHAIGDIVGGVAKGQKYPPGVKLREIPYLRVANVQRGYLDLSVIKTILASEDEIETLRLRPGDILFTEGGDRDKLGRGWVWGGEIPECIHQNHIFRARLYSMDVKPVFLSWHGNSFGQIFFKNAGKQSVNLASINMTQLRGFPIPLPPKNEQLRIISEVERRLSVIEALDRFIHANTLRAVILRQSILKSAFSGNLVSQDPKDEPAKVLLARIQTERAKAQPMATTCNIAQQHTVNEKKTNRRRKI